ncbi:Dabb family protein [Yoonia sp. 208BN28-4]|uniref:Dabb family protein n=1 Tax=Yoonia sp. 208BN28-4 TaxID=3126505 RepID=UPI0030AB6C4C
MIRHIVMLNLADGYDPVELLAVLTELSLLDLPGFTAFEHGPNRDFEGRSPAYPYGFVCTFDNEDALSLYAADPTHQALGKRLVALCKADGIMVVDLAVAAMPV